MNGEVMVIALANSIALLFRQHSKGAFQ